jgi:hypothetical protein
LSWDQCLHEIGPPFDSGLTVSGIATIFFPAKSFARISCVPECYTASKNSMHTTLLHFRHFQRSLHWHCENTPQNSLNVQMGLKVSYVHEQQLKRFTILTYFSTIFPFPFGRIFTKIDRPLAKMILATQINMLFFSISLWDIILLVKGYYYFLLLIIG